MDKSLHIFGIRTLEEALVNKQSIDKVWMLQGERSGLFKRLEKNLKAEQIQINYVPIEKFHAFKNENHQGVMARLSPVTIYDLETLLEQDNQKQPLYLLLDHVTDTHNLGAILRSAAATGVSGVILPETGSAPLNATTIKTSAGALFETPIAKVRHLKDAIFLLKAHGISTIGLTEKAHTIAYKSQLNGPLAIVMGSEDKGIHPSILKLLDQSVKLPMASKVASLNVSVATGLILYEIIRQRQFA